jgi:hypothetical protein
MEPSAGSDRAWTERHGFLGRNVRAFANDLPSESAEDNATVVDDKAGVPVAPFEPLADVLKTGVQAARGNVCLQVSACTRFASVQAFERQPVATPVGFAGGVVIDLLEAEALEPRRGSWA